MDSIWTTNLDNSFTKLNKDLDLDVLIIGGGITGLSCLYQLLNSNLKIALVEANLIGRGVTAKTTGKITYLQENIYSKIKKYVGEESSKLYFDSQKEAIKIIKEIIEKEKIKCDFIRCDSYVFTDKNKINNLRDEKKLLESFGANVYEDISLPDGVNNNYNIYVRDTYVFHPLKYLYALKNIISKKIDIYEKTRILKLERVGDYYICKSNDNTIRAKKVVLATHYPFFIFPFFMIGKVWLERSYVRAYRDNEFFNFSAINIDKPSISIRYHKSGNDIYKIHLTPSYNLCGTCNKNSKENFKDYDYLWSNIDIMTGDYLPFIGEISNNLFLATGYNTWGMTNGTIAGKIIGDIILDKNNSYINLFNPKRCLNLGRISNYFKAIFSNIFAYIYTIILDKNKKNIKLEKIDGKYVYSYKDGKCKYRVYAKCPHLGCFLIYNDLDKTWDCPCHGSRFSIDGKCIEGPSNIDISYDKY